MKQHPVPQHISSYEFKLVGDMTLKQFFQLAGGALIALAIYATPIPGFIKWPLVFIFGALGAALAFLPIEERPLSTWMFAFLKAIYSPTRYVFVATSTEDVFAKTKTPDSTPAPLSQHRPSGFVETFEVAEKSFFQRVSNLFQTTSPQGAQPTQMPSVMPVQPEPVAQGRILETQQVSQPIPQQQPSSRPSFKVVEEMDIPKIQSIQVGAPVVQQAPQPAAPQTNTTPVSPVFRAQGQAPGAVSATFNNQASPPSPPSIPNTVVGQVLSADGKIIDSAIMEIKDLTGKPVRAIKTNKVGHFITVTPLADGEYVIETEKDGFTFDPVKFTANSGIIPPIQIKAK